MARFDKELFDKERPLPVGLGDRKATNPRRGGVGIERRKTPASPPSLIARPRPVGGLADRPLDLSAPRAPRAPRAPLGGSGAVGFTAVAKGANGRGTIFAEGGRPSPESVASTIATSAAFRSPGSELTAARRAAIARGDAQSFRESFLNPEERFRSRLLRRLGRAPLTQETALGLTETTDAARGRGGASGLDIAKFQETQKNNAATQLLGVQRIEAEARRAGDTAKASAARSMITLMGNFIDPVTGELRPEFYDNPVVQSLAKQAGTEGFPAARTTVTPEAFAEAFAGMVARGEALPGSEESIRQQMTDRGFILL